MRRALALGALLIGGVVHAQATADAPTLSAPMREALGIETEAGAALYAAGRSATLAFRLDAAAPYFRQLGEAEPQSPASAFGLEAAALFRALMTESDDDFDRFYALNDSLSDLAASLPPSPALDLVVATGLLHRALAMGRQERYARAGSAFKDACGQFRDLARQDASLPDVSFGLGVCEVAAGAIPRKYRWLARLFGFTGSVSSGMDKLKTATAADGAFVVESVVALAISDATLNERRAGSVDMLVALARSVPDSPLLAYLEGYHLLLDRRAEEAVAAFERGKAATAAAGVQPVPFLDAHLGLALFRLDRFAEAAPLLDAFARTFRGKGLVAQSTLHAGLAYEMLGDRRRAESLYRRVRASRDYDSDRSAVREAKQRLESPLTEADRLLLLGANAYDSGRYETTIATLQPVVTDSSLDPVQRGEAAYRTGRAYQALENGPEAIRHFQLAITRPGDPLAKWGPWSQYHVGEVYEAAGRLADARQAYERVLDNEDEFDYHQALEQRVRTALERIAR